MTTMLWIWFALFVAAVVNFFVASPIFSLALSVAQLAAFIAQAVIVVRMVRELRQRERGDRSGSPPGSSAQRPCHPRRSHGSE